MPFYWKKNSTYVGINSSDSLEHRSHKYIRKYRSKSGNWVYVYVDKNGKLVSRDKNGQLKQEESYELSLSSPNAGEISSEALEYAKKHLTDTLKDPYDTFKSIKFDEEDIAKVEIEKSYPTIHRSDGKVEKDTNAFYLVRIYPKDSKKIKSKWVTFHFFDNDLKK